MSVWNMSVEVSVINQKCRDKCGVLKSVSPVQRRAGAGHCCLQVDSLRILLAAEMPFREGFEEELERRSDLGLSDADSVPFTHSGFATAQLRSGARSSSSSSSSSSVTCPVKPEHPVG